MPKSKKSYRFVVNGTGRFPVDMLRYDRCFPRNTADALSIAGTYNLEGRGVTWSIELVSDYGMPTIDRWRSFGWGCGLVGEI